MFYLSYGNAWNVEESQDAKTLCTFIYLKTRVPTLTVQFSTWLAKIWMRENICRIQSFKASKHKDWQICSVFRFEVWILCDPVWIAGLHAMRWFQRWRRIPLCFCASCGKNTRNNVANNNNATCIRSDVAKIQNIMKIDFRNYVDLVSTRVELYWVMQFEYNK